jgi:nucleotide-binding universal stress UspA family protein
MRGAEVKTILLAYDDSEPSRRALDRTATLAEAFGSRVLVTSIASLVHSSPRSVTQIDRGGGVGTHTDEVRQAQAMLEERGIAVESVTAVGDPASSIAQLAEDRDADLVVVGTRGVGPVQRLLGQSVSQAVSRRVSCDLLIVHPGRGEEED